MDLAVKDVNDLPVNLTVGSGLLLIQADPIAADAPARTIILDATWAPVIAAWLWAVSWPRTPISPAAGVAPPVPRAPAVATPPEPGT